MNYQGRSGIYFNRAFSVTAALGSYLYNCYPPKDVVAYWKFDEASGTRFDSIGANNLTDNNNVGQAVGKVGNAAQFVTSGSKYLSKSTSADVEMNGTSFTISCWVYLDTVPGGEDLITKWTSSADQSFNLSINAGVPFFAVRNAANSATVEVMSSVTLTTGTWYFIVAGLDIANNIVFVQVNNGTRDTLANTGGIRNGTSRFIIGARNDPTGFFNGRVDEVGIWKRILTTNELSVLYNLSLYAIPRVTMLPGKSISLQMGSYVLTGFTAALRSARSIIATRGTYTLTGNNATITRFVTLVATAGSYILTGFTTGLGHIRTMIASQGSYALSGQAVSFKKAWKMTVIAGSYILTGIATGLSHVRTLTAVQGAYTLTGEAVTFIKTKTISAVRGVYTLLGFAVLFLKDGESTQWTKQTRNNSTFTDQSKNHSIWRDQNKS